MSDASDDFVAPSGDAPSAAAASRSREHDLKCWPEFFKHLWSGEKTFEIRKDDRGYQAGDTLTLREWTERHGYSGRWIKYDVPFLLGGIWPGLGPEHVCMSIKEIERSRLPPAAAREDVEPWEGAPAKVPVWVRDVRLVLRDLQALHENVEEGRDIPQHIYKGASAALRALDHQFLMGEIPPNPPPAAWRDLHPKIADQQFLLTKGVSIDENGFLHLDRVAMTAIWQMLLDLQTAAHDLHPHPAEVVNALAKQRFPQQEGDVPPRHEECSLQRSSHDRE
jgi:hypothetical protein